MVTAQKNWRIEWSCCGWNRFLNFFDVFSVFLCQITAYVASVFVSLTSSRMLFTHIRHTHIKVRCAVHPLMQ